MKILYHHRIGSRDGQAVHIDEIVGALRTLGHEVIVVGPKATEHAKFGSDGVVVATFKRFLPGSIYELLELAYSCVAFIRLWRVYRRERPDALYERYNLYLLSGVWLKRLTGVPMLLEINSPLVLERSRYGGLANRRMAAWAERFTWRSANHVLPVTSVLAGFVRAVGVPIERITVIQNGVGEEFLSNQINGTAVRERLGCSDGIILGFIGFVREWHGLDRVIELVADSDPLLDLYCVIVGQGPAIPELQRLTAQRGLERRVIFAGLISRDEIVEYVAAFDVALQPQVVPYASPLKLFEYMALGRAIVAPASPNILEVLTDRDAMLFDPADPFAFRRAVEQLCGDANLRTRLGKAARDALVRHDLTWASNARRIVALVEGQGSAGERI
jgi:glycosyltransferase involved in cell wall biosynthesis